MATFLAITYSEADRAKRAMETVINWLDVDRLVDVQGACWVSKDEGELKVYPRGRHTAGKAAAGSTLGLPVGGLFGLASGTAAGIYRARRTDDVIDEAFVAAIGEQLASFAHLRAGGGRRRHGPGGAGGGQVRRYRA